MGLRDSGLPRRAAASRLPAPCTPCLPSAASAPAHVLRCRCALRCSACCCPSWRGARFQCVVKTHRASPRRSRSCRLAAGSCVQAAMPRPRSSTSASHEHPTGASPRLPLTSESFRSASLGPSGARAIACQSQSPNVRATMKTIAKACSGPRGPERAPRALFRLTNLWSPARSTSGAWPCHTRLDRCGRSSSVSRHHSFRRLS